MAIKINSISITTTQSPVLQANIDEPHRLALFNSSAAITLHPTGDTNSAITLPSNQPVDVGIIRLDQATLAFTAGAVSWWADPA